MSFTHVDTPIAIGPVQLKNRVCRAAHGTGFADLGCTEEFIAYHEARAAGGVGLTILEIFAVHRTSPRGLNWWDESLADGYRELVDRCGRHGMKLFQQLWHGGHNTLPPDGSPPWSASDSPGPRNGVVPIAMTRAMIAEVVDGFAQAARACERWGMDGVEVHAAHGYLLAQFLSPHHNRREDEYGGDFENRSRIIVEILEAIRAVVSPDYPVGIRLGPDLTVGGIDIDMCKALCGLLESRRLVDFVDISYGSYEHLEQIYLGMDAPAGYQLPSSALIGAAVSVPTIVTGRFRTLEEADQILRNGDADIVSMVRAHIADPELVRKTLAGRVDDVRPCIACNQGCVGGISSPAHWMGCTVNPAVGFEKTMAEEELGRASAKKRVLVVGGGPAGMEAARVAALRGHQVVLMEAGNALGGALRLAALAPARHGIGDIAFWLERQIFKLGVDVRLSTFVDMDDILIAAPDCVILATGAWPRLDGVLRSNPGEPVIGIGMPHVLSSRDLLVRSSDDFGTTAVVIDDVGHHEGISAAEFLLRKGVAVSYVTALPSFAPLMETTTLLPAILRRLQTHDFDILTCTRAVSIAGDAVMVASSYGSADARRLKRLPAQTVVFVSADRPNSDLVPQLEAAGISVTTVGDALSPRFLPSAIRQGHLAGMVV